MRSEEIVVVGGGPSGVAAAVTARRLGASVTLIDEQPEIGGYMRWTLSEQQGMTGELSGKRGFELAGLFWTMLYDLGVNVQRRSTAWGLFEDRVLGVVNPESSYQLKAQSIILATGSTDAGVPFPGWELAGVMTARAALIAMNMHRVLPGRRVALVGDGPDAAEVRESLELAGAEIVVHIPDTSLCTVGGDGVIEWIERQGNRETVETVISVHGSQPDPALALQAQADTGYSTLSGMHVPLRSDVLESTLPGIFVVGDAAGLCSTEEAYAEGKVAAAAATGRAEIEEALVELAATRSSQRAAELDRLRPAVSVSQSRKEV